MLEQTRIPIFQLPSNLESEVELKPYVSRKAHCFKLGPPEEFTDVQLVQILRKALEPSSKMIELREEIEQLQNQLRDLDGITDENDIPNNINRV